MLLSLPGSIAGVDVDGPGLRVDGADQRADAEPMQQPIAGRRALDEAEQRLRHGVIDLGALAVVLIGFDQGLLGVAERGRLAGFQTLHGAPERDLIESGSMLEALNARLKSAAGANLIQSRATVASRSAKLWSRIALLRRRIAVISAVLSPLRRALATASRRRSQFVRGERWSQSRYRLGTGWPG
jgi:hypothetical protein